MGEKKNYLKCPVRRPQREYFGALEADPFKDSFVYFFFLSITMTGFFFFNFSSHLISEELFANLCTYKMFLPLKVPYISFC